MFIVYDYYSRAEELDLYEEVGSVLNLDLEDNFDYTGFSRIEHIIARDARLAFAYADFIINGRWERGEPIIATQPSYALDYARSILYDRFILGEPNIMKDSYSAFHYARHVLKSRWLEAEPYIKKSEFWWSKYKVKFRVVE